jgi:hypothetical protein
MKKQNATVTIEELWKKFVQDYKVEGAIEST